MRRILQGQKDSEGELSEAMLQQIDRHPSCSTKLGVLYVLRYILSKYHLIIDYHQLNII